MTISSTNRIAGPFIGAGTTATFPFTFKVFSAADLEVVRVLVSTGAETTLTLTTDYTVSLNGNQNTNPGGSITLVAGNLATGYNLVITSNVANTQPVDLTNQGGFYPEVINDALDRATIQIQQLNDTALNAVHAPVTDGALLMELPAAGIRANKYLAFDASGLPLVADGTSTPAVTSGGDLTFTVNDAGAGVAQDFIFVNDTTEVMRLKGATTRLGIGTAAPATALDVVGAGKFSGNLTVNTNTLFVDTANNWVGIVNATPTVPLDVTGAGKFSTSITAGTGTFGTSGDVVTVASDGSIKAQSSLATAVIDVRQTSAPTVTTFSVNRLGDVVAGRNLRVVTDLTNDALIGSGIRNVNTTAAGILTTATSDARLKTNVSTIVDGLSIVQQLRPVRYTWIDTDRLGTQVEVGLIAQEVQPVLPEVIGTNHDGMFSLDYSKIVAVLIGAIQQLNARIAALEAAP